MAALNFPDPNVTTSYTNPDTGITYEWANGIWKAVRTAQTAPELFVDAAGDTMTGALVLDNAASASAPDLSFDGDANTGIYSPGSDKLAVATDGTQRVLVTGGNVGFGPSTSLGANVDANASGTTSCIVRARNDTTTVYLDANNGYSYLNCFTNHPLLFGTNNAERLRIDSEGRILVGASTARSNFNNNIDGATLVQLEGTTYGTSALSITRNSNDPGSPTIQINKTRGTSNGQNTIVANGDPFGFINFAGTDGTNSVRGASISAWCDGTPGTGDMPGRLVLATTADGASSPTERMRINSAGNVGVGTTSINNKFVIASPGSTPAYFHSVNASTGTSGTDGLIMGMGDATNAYIWNYESGSTIFATNGTPRMRIDSAGNVGIGTSSVPYKFVVSNNGAAGLEISPNQGVGDGAFLQSFNRSTFSYLPLTHYANAHVFWTGTGTNSYERMRLDSSGRLLVGTSSARSDFYTVFGSNSAAVQTEGITGNTARVSQVLNVASAAGPDLILGKSRGTTVGSNTVVAANDRLGTISFQGADGTGLESAAEINGFVDGTPGANDMPGRLVFSTTADGASSPSESLRINNAGIHYLPRNYNGNNSSVLTANVFIFSDGSIGRYTSSGKYKTQVEDLEDKYADKILELRPTWYRSLCTRDNPKHSTYGFIAEEVAEIDPRLVHFKTIDVTYDEKGAAVESPCDPEPEGVNYTMMIPHLVNIIKRQKKQIEAMEARLSALEAQ